MRTILEMVKTLLENLRTRHAERRQADSEGDFVQRLEKVCRG